MKILNDLTIKHLKMNKKRTIVTIIGIILSTALMVGIGLLFSTVQDNSVRTLKMSTGDYHSRILDLPEGKLDILANNHHVKDYYYEKPIGFSEFSESRIVGKKYFFVNSVSENYFDQIKLVKGRFPKNDTEIVISNHMESESGVSYHVGDQLTLKLGSRMVDGEETYQNVSYFEEETFHAKEEKSYTVVGIIERPVFENWEAAGYTFLTKYLPSKGDVLNVYLRFTKPSRAYQDSEVLVKNLGLSKDENGEYPIDYNDPLLALYGASKYDNIISTFANILMIILTLISIGCVVVIYNSFAISVMERKKQFGLFSSIGATKKQLRHTVFFEALIVGMIGIPLGVVGSFIGIGSVLALINHLLPDLFGTNLMLTVYPLFFIIPIIFMIITILVSAYIPAYKASKITPIEAIRLNDDIKIKNKKLKTGKWISKLFGVEGEIALKNIKRNKKKYRITVASLFISIVLFISFSTFVEYGLKTSASTLQIPDYDIKLTLSNPTTYDYGDFIDQVKRYEGVKKDISVKYGQRYSVSYDKSIYSDSVLNDYGISDDNFVTLNVITLDQKHYDEYLKSLGLNQEQPILLDKIHYTVYEGNKRKNYERNLLKEKKDYVFDLCKFKKSDFSSDDSEISKNDFDCSMKLENVYVTDQAPMAIEFDFLSSTRLSIIIPEKLFDKIFTLEDDSYLDDMSIYLKTSDYKKVDQYIREYMDKLTDQSVIQYYNFPKDMKQMNNLYLVIAVLLYGFITLVTLIGVTSVFNTINTSIALRRKEFAVLRSMGLTPHGFNKILYFESFFFGAKSLLYAIPFSFLVILWIHVVMMNVSSFTDIMIPWKSVGIAILGVFIIVFITMMYATKKMKHENILDAIREENI